MHEVEKAFFTFGKLGQRLGNRCIVSSRLLVHPIQQVGLCIDGKSRGQFGVLFGSVATKARTLHAGFEFTPGKRKQVIQGGGVDQQANHFQPHVYPERPDLFEGIVLFPFSAEMVLYARVHPKS